MWVSTRNQVLLFVFGAGILSSLVSGWVMFFKRRKSGTAIWLALKLGNVTAIAFTVHGFLNTECALTKQSFYSTHTLM